MRLGSFWSWFTGLFRRKKKKSDVPVYVEPEYLRQRRESVRQRLYDLKPSIDNFGVDVKPTRVRAGTGGTLVRAEQDARHRIRQRGVKSVTTPLVDSHARSRDILSGVTSGIEPQPHVMKTIVESDYAEAELRVIATSPTPFEDRGGQFSGAGASDSWEDQTSACPPPSYSPPAPSYSSYSSPPPPSPSYDYSSSSSDSSSSCSSSTD